MTGMARGLPGSIEDIGACSPTLSRADCKIRYRIVPKGTNECLIEAVREATVGDGALQPSVGPPRMKPTAFWYAGEETWYQTGPQEEGSAEIWKRSRR